MYVAAAGIVICQWKRSVQLLCCASSILQIPTPDTFPAAGYLYDSVVRKLCEEDERVYERGFTDPIDFKLYPHYDLSPICLGDIRTRLEKGEYK